MTDYGLSKQTINQIYDVFDRFPEIEKIMIYGSRAKGNYHTGSDIDLTLLGSALNENLLLKIENQLEDIMLPYSFDLSLFDQLQNNDLIDHINRVGKIFYIKNSHIRGSING